MLISAYDDECKLNALWVLGSLMENDATMQRTTLQATTRKSLSLLHIHYRESLSLTFENWLCSMMA